MREHLRPPIFVVPLTGLEPVWYPYRGILSPLRLPIPPQRRMKFDASARWRPAKKLLRPIKDPSAAASATVPGKACRLPYRPRVTKKASPKTMPFAWRRHPDLNRGVRVLQTLALPLGYGADFPLRENKKQRGNRVWSGKRDSNPRHSPWQGDALPLSYSRIIFDSALCWWKQQGSNL